ncbi:hypothetical protein LUZ60_006302 [Juncus effusus]|nr:hypothetical protein LUZ60_006302 [Juncus effusus]
MERKAAADLPPPPATSASARPIPAAAGGDPNLTTASTSSTSSSSLSPSDPYRQLYAALKRHKPLGTMQSNLPRARRVLVSRPEPTKSTLARPSISSRTQNKEPKWPQLNAGTVPVGTARGDSSLTPPFVNPPFLTPPSLTETLNDNNNNNKNNGIDKEIGLENHEKKVGDEMLVDLKQTDFNLKASNSNENAPINTNENNNFGDKLAFRLPDAPQDTKMENKVSSHLHSLALTEEMNPNPNLQNPYTNFHGSNSNIMDPNKKFQNLNTKFQGSNSKLLDPNPLPKVQNPNLKFEGSNSKDPITQINPIRNQDPLTQCSIVNSSCITKHLANYQNAPVEKKISIQSEPQPSKDKIDKIEKKEKEKEKSKKKGYDSEAFCKVNGKYYQKLGKIGSGGSSEVHKVISADKIIYALKKIKLKGRDYQTALGFCQEIEYLNKLKGKNHIIQLIDYEITDKSLMLLEGSSDALLNEGRIREDHYIFMVLEYGEIDLAHMVQQKWRELNHSSTNPVQIDENWLRFYWQQMLEAVNTIHEERIVHSDLKPANFLLVQGSLKLIDFGIAKAIMNDTTNIQRDAQVGTLNYMSPEAFMCNEEDSSGARIKCGRPSDIWSLGCIFFQMVYGKTPFADYTSFWAKLRVVTNKDHQIVYKPVRNPWLVDLMRRCLRWERAERWRIEELLRHPFLKPPVLPSGMGGMESSGVCWNRPEVLRLCGEIGEVIRRMEEEEEGKMMGVDME